MLRRLGTIITALPLLGVCVAGYSQASAPYPTAKLTVNGSETQPGGVWDSGTITIDFNGYVENVIYGQYSSPASLASALAAMFTRDYSTMGLYAKAGANGPLIDPTVITFQLVNGKTFAPINIVDPSASFSFSPSGFASSTATVADRGTATLTVAGTTVSASYGDGSTAATIAQDLALKANLPLVTVTAQGANLYLQSKQTTGSFNYAYSLSFSSGSTSFSSSPAAGALTGSTDAAPFTVYSYSVTNSSGQSGYDATGNLLNVTDSVMGTWSYTYDNLNRLTSGTATSGTYTGQYTCWSYDSFGNRTFQSVSTTPCASSPPATFAAAYSSNNQISSVTSPANMTIAYDAAGNITNDGYNTYLYDAESRVCAVKGPEGIVVYQYDADGNRVGKGTNQTLSCDVTSPGYQPMTDYVLDQNGGQMSEVGVGGGQSNWTHTNVTANGMLIATYDTVGLHFYLNDALGSRRAQTDPAGFPEQNCQSLPFGDQLYCTVSLTSPTEHHFTGKERDTESGFDYFGARYYSSNMGRFSSPDPSGLYFADPTNPQSLNLYAYALNNPLRFTDPNGLYCFYGDPNNGNDNMDSSQFDFHSSQGECTAPDENGNSGQWINDGATHYTQDGYVDNDGRPESYVMNANVNSGPSTNIIQTGVSDGVGVLTTVGGALADLTIGISNGLGMLTGSQPLPYFRLFGTHYCGPGGGSSPNGGLDPACKAHDDCYAAAGLSAASNGSGASLTLDQAAAAQGCNQALYDAARGHPNQLNGSAPLRQWLTYGDQVPFGHLAPGTEAQPW